MYSNAGIRSHTLSNNNNSSLPNNRHIPSTSDPPYTTSNHFSPSSSLSIFGGHHAHRSEDGILSAAATPPRSASMQANTIRSSSRTVTTVLAPPSSFHALPKTSTSVSSFSRQSPHVASSSPSSIAYNINHNKAPSSSNLSLYLSRSARSKPASQTTPSVSRSSSISRQNGVNCPGMAQPESAAPQRINMKRLMSKPTAILVPDRAQSAMAFVPQPPLSDTDDSASIGDHLAIKSHSLDILRRSKRRSRSVDLMKNYGAPPSPSHPRLSPDGSPHRVTASIGPTSTSLTPRGLAATGRVRSLTRSPSFPSTTLPAPILLPDSNNTGLSSAHESANSPGFALSPASVIALAWTESQKRAKPSTPIVGVGESSPSSAIPKTEFTALDSLGTASVSSPIVFADTNEVPYRVDLSSPPIIMNSPEEAEESEEEDPFTPWAFAQQGLVPRSQPAARGVSNPSTKGGGYDGSKAGVAATMREVSRRFTGAFGRGEKKQGKGAVARFPINHPPSSFSIGSFPPNLKPNACPSSSFSAKPVSKAPKSHERARSLTLSRITGAVKNGPLSNDQLLQASNQHLVAHRQPANPNPFTTEFGHLNHTLLHLHLNTSAQVDLTGPSNSFEVATSRQHTPLEMPSWSLLHSSSIRRATVDENGQELTLSRQDSSQFANSPLSPANSEQGRISTPVRNNTPNTLKKRSRPSLRGKPSSSAIAPVSSIATEGTSTFMSHSTRVLSSDTPPSLTLSEGVVTGGKLRGLVRKLSSGALARSSSQSDRSRSSQSNTGARGYSPPVLREIHSVGADVVPPVPEIPKDFELILDADAYFAERARLRAEEKFDSDGESIPSGQGSGGPNTTLKIPNPSQMSSRHSSFLGHKEQIPVDVDSLSSSLNSRLRVDTEPDRAASSSKRPVRRPVPPIHGVYAFPKGTNMPLEHTSSSNSQTDHVGAGYRSSSPSQSSSDLHAVHRLFTAAVAAVSSGSYEEKGSVSSHSHEMASSYPNSIIAQPIMAPKELYQRGEDEAATLRRQKNKEPFSTRPQRKKSGGALPTGRNVGSQEHSPVTPPPPILSPLLLPLTAPPPRPPRRVTRVQSSTVLGGPSSRPTHKGHQRSLSSPISPTIPTFLTTKIADAIPLSKRSRSVGGRLPSPRVPAEVESSSPTMTPAKRARSNSLSRKAKHLPQLVVRSKATESASHVSPDSAAGKRSVGGNTSQPKMRVKTSLGTITQQKSAVTPKSASSPKSASHTPSSSTSYTMSPQSSGRRSSSSRTSRDHSLGQGWVAVDDGEAPPMPFTSTAFTFKEISHVAGASPGRGKLLTEGEREDLWNALLSRSDRVGGTLTLSMDQTEGPALLSDKASFREG